MKSKLITIVCLSLCCGSAMLAQNTTFPNRLSVGVDYVGVQSAYNPNTTGLGYHLGYARQLVGGRFALGGQLGYISAPGRMGSYGEYRSEGRKSERFTADLTFSYDLFRRERQAFRLGVGPSVWYRKDDEYRGYGIVLGPEFTVIDVDFEREQAEEANFGFHLTGEYEYLVTPRVALTGRAGFAHFFKTGFNPMAGIGLGYRF